MSDFINFKVLPKSFSITPGELGMITEADLKAAQGKCVDDVLREQEKMYLQAMGFPRRVIERKSRIDSALRKIMADEFIEENAHDPSAQAYWELIATA